MVDDDLIETLKALAHPLRWHILATLAAGERNVGEIEAASGITQPGLSQQLGVLRKAGLVSTRKDAKLVFYSIAAEEVQKVAAVVSVLAPQSASVPAARESPRISAPGVANFARMS